MSTLEKSLERITNKKGYSVPLVEAAISAYHTGEIKHNMITDFLTRRELIDRLYKIRDCGRIYEIREYSGRPVIHNGNYCKNPIVCPVCADRVSRRRRAMWAPRIRQAVKRFPFVYMLVLTIEDGPDLQLQLKRLIRARKIFRLQGQRRGAGKRSAGEYGKVQAGTINTEIITNEKGDWHIHDHQLIFCSDPLDYEMYDRQAKKELEKIHGRGNIPEGELFKIAKSYTFFKGKLIPVSKISREWIRATAGQGINIKCVPLNYRSFLDKGQRFKNRFVEKYEDWLVFNSVECLKYNSKLSLDLQHKKISPQQYSDLILKKGNTRLFNTVGAFRQKNDSLYFDQQEQDRLEYIEEIKQSEYTIRGATFDDRIPGFVVSGPLNGPLFSDSDPPGEKARYRLHVQGQVMGEYRRARKCAMLHREKKHPIEDGFPDRLEMHLDRLRESLRGHIKDIWSWDLSELNFSRFAVPAWAW